MVFDHEDEDRLAFCRVGPRTGRPGHEPDPEDVFRWQQLVLSWADGIAGAGPADDRSGQPG